MRSPQQGRRRTARPGWHPHLLGWLAISFVGCAITVIDSSISEDAKYGVLIGSKPVSPRTLFTPEHEKVTFRVQFNNNLSGEYQTFRVDWVGPDGAV